MATFTKRTYTSYRVRGDGSPLRAFRTQEQANAYARELQQAGTSEVKASKFTSVRWQVKIRSSVTNQKLTQTFDTKAVAVEWAQQREGEIAKRQIVDYKSAAATTLGDLLRKYDTKVLVGKKKLPASHPDRSRVRLICRDPIAAIRMSVLQPSDISAYRDKRTGIEPGEEAAAAGADYETASDSAVAGGGRGVKGSTVNKELELMSRVIALAQKEWKLFLPQNPASGRLAARAELTEADERDRRLEECVRREALVPARDRRQSADEEFELDPEVQELLAMPQSEQQLLLRALRYPEWFRPRKKNVTKATLRARATRVPRRLLRARLRPTGRAWAPVSFAIETAMRRLEMVRLKWEHVHFGKGHGYLLLPGWLTKNGQSRMVPLTLRASRILRTQPRTSEYVFDTNVNTIKLAYKRAKERVHIEDLRLHDLRHEATSRLFERTILRPVEIGSITGHNDPRMLDRYYNKRPGEFVERFLNSFTKPE